MASRQAETIGVVNRKKVEAGQQEQENSGKRKDSVYSHHAAAEEAREESLVDIRYQTTWLSHIRIIC